VEPQQEEVPVPPVQEDAPAQPEEPLAPREDHPDAAADAPGGDDDEVPGRDYFFDEDQDGRIMEVDEEGNLRSPLASPTLVQEDPAPPPEDLVPAPANRDLDDPVEDDEDPIQYEGYYRGGMWEDSDAEEEPLELTDGPDAPDGGDENSVNPPAPPRDARQPPEFRVQREIHYIHDAEGPYPTMLWEALQIIGATQKPHFEAYRTDDPGQ